ncbi:hypothetical protein MNEG_14247 [Monoraphidium neglectum]|uniref:Uncharacterized protein n=1 Tax=Monoraphidium neglectum TaxID=145388 RepID=A0A0D2MF26_9CHLO|nr:hypothetical protein MNEG_14247 [Monoraphidium neglectum]KIY93715.1 hypothetical protein MNEG_14247 [Monoraphidium neglectum]|eukprot:XP_013892735.1 hypothetical protein MNEG_14247 [Monoraphidium neglectum]
MHPRLRSQDNLWAATNGTTNDVATFFGAQPTSTRVGGKLQYVFLAGTDYNFTVTGSGGASCTGTAKITPCTPVCKNVQVNVTATSATSACSVSIGANIFDTSATGFFDTASLGTTATTALLTAVNGTLLAAPQQYPQGTYSVQAQGLAA